MLILLSLGFLAMNLIGPRTRLSLLQQRVLQLCVLVSLLHFLWSITILQLNPHTMMGYANTVMTVIMDLEEKRRVKPGVCRLQRE